jgi:SAM-dependent methyltransferase
MDTLTLEQLKNIPWLDKYASGPDVPKQPPVHEIKKLVNIPFMKRSRKYNLFYSWSEIVKSIGNTPCRVLDAACGGGLVSQILFYKGHKVFACDIQNLFVADKHIDFKLVDLNKDFPYPSDFFDVVINSEGLECLQGSTHFVNESMRVLKNGGRLILSVPNIHSLVGRYNFFRNGLLLSYDTAILDRINIVYLPLVREIYKITGFRIVEIKGNVPLLTFKSRIFNALFGRIVFEKNDRIVRFAHSLIICAELRKKSKI